jgi:DNA-binding transcriptional ArsR family regulator
MSFLNSEFIDNDNELSCFAAAMASPERVAIMRTTTENNNSITREHLESLSLTQGAVNEHLVALKSAGILKLNERNDGLVYCLDEKVFDQMAEIFTALIDSINGLRPQ